MQKLTRNRGCPAWLALAMTVMINVPLLAGSLYIVGNTQDRQAARDAGLSGTYLTKPGDVPSGADVVVLGRPEASGGVSNLDYETLAGIGCRLIRIGADNRRDIRRAAASLKKMIDEGGAPFADVSRTMGILEAPKGYPALGQTEMNKPGKTSLNPAFQPQNLFPRAASPLASLSPAASAIAAALEKHGRVTLDIKFGVESAEISVRSIPLLKQVLEVLKAHPEMRLVVEGHTDSFKATDFNQTLSEQRAGNVRSWLVDRGASGTNLKAVGFGESRPIAPNFTEAGREKNRRVELVKVN